MYIYICIYKREMGDRDSPNLKTICHEGGYYKS